MCKLSPHVHTAATVPWEHARHVAALLEAQTGGLETQPFFETRELETPLWALGRSRRQSWARGWIDCVRMYAACVLKYVRTYVRKSATNSAGGAVRLSCTFCGCMLREIFCNTTSLVCLSVHSVSVNRIPHCSTNRYQNPFNAFSLLCAWLQFSYSVN